MEATFDSILNYIKPIIKNTRKLWKTSKYFRIISIAFGSLSVSLLIRNIYIKSQRKYLGLPPGPMGYPLIGGGLGICNPVWLQNIMAYGPVVSSSMGSKNIVIFNNPDLAKIYYKNPKSLDVAKGMAVVGFLGKNGKEWSERRRIISSNLMSTMKASYVEDVTKKFIKTKLFPMFDADILNGNVTDLKPLFRPIGFNIVLMACFGSELKSLKDPFWIDFDKETTRANTSSFINLLIIFVLKNNKFSDYVQRLVTGTTYKEGFVNLINIIDNYAKQIDTNKNQNKNENVKLFNDYINDYTNNDKSKWTRKDLLSDMMSMFFAATDTTYSALTSALLLAAKYPNIQQEIYEELVAGFDNDINKVELRNGGILKIAKLRSFIHETLRLFPPATVAGFRYLYGETVKLNTSKFGANKDYFIPQNTMTIINVCGINKIAKYWIKDYEKNKEKYKNINMNEPHLDFWLENDGKFSKKKNSSNFFNFHIGKRDCVGQALAMKQLMIVLSMIFMKYKIKHKSGKTDFEIGSVFMGGVNGPALTEIKVTQR